jgi:hypothetical protein
MIERFLDFSAEVTAFTVFDLWGTGQAEAYFAMVVERAGTSTLGQLLDVYQAAPREPQHAREHHLRAQIFDDKKLGPIARNIIRMWYVGIWYSLPEEWHKVNGGHREKDIMVSAAAYTEGLLWPAIGAHPPGAKAPGYGSWTGPPEIPEAPAFLLPGGQR